ncbi:MAG TPA: FtsW/RodA/SpoVE family cell cycle protein [Candidatus Babeliales bacterium]|nr:FtsW/RodA/SpoVE family cell cycle protein [Candidatus Babeliales bacterium]
MIFVNRRILQYFDWISFGIILILMSIGLLFIFSATTNQETYFSIFFKKQLLGIIIGIIIYFLMSIIDYRTTWRLGFMLYFILIGMLLFTYIKGALVMGAQRWINLGFMRFQPSELTKLLFPAFFSYYFYEDSLRPSKLKHFIPVLIILGISTLLILKQPDLGTALILLFSGCTLLWLSGLNRKYFIGAMFFLITSAPITWRMLKPYQRQRIVVFLGQGDAKKERYQIEQSIIAIGSGGLCGKGFNQGTQNKLLFLPESRTDFIFSVVCEEGGFILAMVIILLFILLFARIFIEISFITDFFARLLAVGLIIHIMLSTIINMGMVIGILPTVGIPLPFISYGISNLWVNLASLGWIQSIIMENFNR